MLNFMRYLKCRKNTFLIIADSSFHTSSARNQISKPLLRSQQKLSPRISPVGWFLLVIPVSTFSLGVWQIKRKLWKENLIAEMHTAMNSDPVKLPTSLEEIKKLEYKPVHVKGEFLHEKEMYMGPRTLLENNESSTSSSLVSSRSTTSTGYLVVTPFKLADRDETILVNRGWVPVKNRDKRTREEGQVKGVVDLIGVVRLHENRPPFTIKNKEGSNIWFHRDLEKMAEVASTSPIFLDATIDFDVKGGPVGGQTRINLRNEHLSYILTWFSLSGATSYMWYRKFIKKG